MKVTIHNATPYKLDTRLREEEDGLHLTITAHDRETVFEANDARPGNSFSIFVNGVAHHFHRARWTMSYKTVIVLAGYGTDRTPSVTFKHGAPEKPDGILMPGQSVPARDGMVFNVADTSNA